jgi:guanylate kinase
MGRLIIITAPSGSGKSTIVHHLLKSFEQLSFSISATTRAKRAHEVAGKDYYFIDQHTFKQYVHQRRFVEWVELYPGQRMYPKKSLAIYIRPPSIEVLRSRLVSRGTETAEKLENRVKRAAMEMKYENTFDAIVLNDDLEKAKADASGLISRFLHGS